MIQCSCMRFFDGPKTPLCSQSLKSDTGFIRLKPRIGGFKLSTSQESFKPSDQDPTINVLPTSSLTTTFRNPL